MGDLDSQMQYPKSQYDHETWCSPHNNRVERIARGHHGLCSVGPYGVGLTANPALVPSALVPPGQRATAVLTAHSSVIRPEKIFKNGF